ncbi:MAG: FlhB-like flagellar biosynthesis protein [Synergistetes bacterium]|nr:MAG: FlhB domain protein [bacterium 42_11]MBC7331036.1 FlhB-like flagellar biosynthesis protein [Synergistota bacterium]MDK2871573.1 flagellar biosynthesis protein [bacterium]
MREEEKRRKAAALKYNEEEDRAPKVVASGRGRIAEKIVEIAKEYNIPIYEDPDLVELLLKVDIGEEIPPELYKAVAEVLAFIYKLREVAKG